MEQFTRQIDRDQLWSSVQSAAREDAQEQVLLSDFYWQNILQYSNFTQSLAHVIASKLAPTFQELFAWRDTLSQVLGQHPAIERAALEDLRCQLQSNAAIKGAHTPLLYFGGFHALQAYRFAHHYWCSDNTAMANYIQGRSVAEFGVDIHPGAKIGQGIFIDHAVGIVIGETAVVEDQVTLFQSVTLGGTGKGSGDRHPKVRRGAFIGSGAVVLGNIEIGENAKVGAGAVVVKSVPSGQSVTGQAATLKN